MTNGLRVTIYIDGFNLYYGLLKPNPALRWLDLAALVSARDSPGQFHSNVVHAVTGTKRSDSTRPFGTPTL